MGAMTPAELQERTMQFALRVLRVAEALPRTRSGNTIGAQLARSGTSVAANYRAARRGKSRADFISKITTVLEEVDEAAFWLEMIERRELLSSVRLRSLRNEAGELTRIFSATRLTAKNHRS